VANYGRHSPFIDCPDLRALPPCRNLIYNNALTGPLPKEWSTMTAMSEL
jgi:hypothetical protein